MMNQEDILKKIGQILAELNEQYAYLIQNPVEFNELELELFQANASFLSDHVNIVKKLHLKTLPKALPEHTVVNPEEVTVHQPVIKATEVMPLPDLEQEIFKPDNESSSFEFILSDKTSADRFEFEEKSVDEIFDRPLSKEEEFILAQKQKLRELDSLGIQLPEEEEEGPEPFLLVEPLQQQEQEFTGEPFLEAIPVVEEPAAAESLQQQEQEFTEQPFLEAIPVMEEPAAAEPLQQQEQEFTEQPLFEAIPVVEEPAAAKALTAEEQPLQDAAPKTQAQPVRSGGWFSKPTLNDTLSGHSPQQQAGSTSGRTVTDLRQAISLNDKMRYIKDLFNGYNLAYAEAIDLLNKMPDFKTADAFLQKNYALKNNWAEKPDTADQFYELLGQRFPEAK